MESNNSPILASETTFSTNTVFQPKICLACKKTTKQLGFSSQLATSVVEYNHVQMVPTWLGDNALKTRICFLHIIQDEKVYIF